MAVHLPAGIDVSDEAAVTIVEQLSRCQRRCAPVLGSQFQRGGEPPLRQLTGEDRKGSGGDAVAAATTVPGRCPAEQAPIAGPRLLIGRRIDLRSGAIRSTCAAMSSRAVRQLRGVMHRSRLIRHRSGRLRTPAALSAGGQTRAIRDRSRVRRGRIHTAKLGREPADGIAAAIVARLAALILARARDRRPVCGSRPQWPVEPGAQPADR